MFTVDLQSCLAVYDGENLSDVCDCIRHTIIGSGSIKLLEFCDELDAATNAEEFDEIFSHLAVFADENNIWIGNFNGPSNAKYQLKRGIMRQYSFKAWEDDQVDLAYVLGQLDQAEASIRTAVEIWNNVINVFETANDDSVDSLKDVANGVSEYLMDAIKLRRNLKNR